MSGYGCFAEYYDLLTSNIDYAEMCDYYLVLFEKYGKLPESVLDLGCGTGNMSVELAKRGIDVTGVDSSHEMLSIAAGKNDDEVNVSYICQDMKGLDLYSKLDGAVCTLDGLNHILTLEELEQVFKRVSYFINDSGLFIFDMNSEYKHRKVLNGQTFVYDMEDVYLVWQNSYNRRKNTVHIELDFFVRDGVKYNRFTDNFYERAYKTEDIVTAFEKNGFKLVTLFGDFTFNAPQNETERLVFVIRKE